MVKIDVNAKLLLFSAIVGLVGCVSWAHGEEDSLGWLAYNDVVYLSAAREGWKGLPLGNGTLGAMVWHPNALFFQLNTSWGTVLGSSPGRVRLRTSPGLLSDVKSYRQRLSLLTATLLTEIETTHGPIRIKAWMIALKLEAMK